MRGKKITLEDSESILKEIVQKEDFIDFRNHKAWPHKGLGENVYRFDVNMISLDMLINIMEHPQIENVYFTPAASGPGIAMDGISFTYKIYVKYHFPD